jgi:ubiquinone/menaquinone biosynthesis C-methylase UbiE
MQSAEVGQSRFSVRCGVEIAEYEKMYNLEDSHWWFVGKRRIVKNLIEEFVPLNQRETVLDVGCGTGAAMRFLDHYGQVYGIDISEAALCFCQERALSGLSRASALRLPFADSSFSLITAFDVLYHKEVVDDLTALKEFYRVCKEGGSVLISEPAFNFLWSWHDVAYHSKRRYVASELGSKVEQVGFQVVKLSYSNALVFPFTFAFKMWKRFSRPSPEDHSDVRPLNPYLNKALLAVYGLEASLVCQTRLPVGSSVVCVARKPFEIPNSRSGGG